MTPSHFAFVTGSTDGVGRVVAVRLASRNMHVFVHGRDSSRGAEVTNEIRAAGGSAEFLQADFASLANVDRLAHEVQRRTTSLQLLINNAGIGTGGRGARRQESADGIELRFAVNYLAGFLLTQQLLPLLKADTPSRIVNVSSIGQAPIDFDDPMLERSYNGAHAYMQSKLAQAMFTIDLAQTLEGTGVTVNSLHPATYMNTTMVRQAGVAPMSTVEEGASAILNLAESPELAHVSGRFFNGLGEARAQEQAYDAHARQRLQTLTMDRIRKYQRQRERT